MRTKTELSQLDEKTSLQLIVLQSTRDDDDDDELMNLKNVKMKKKKKKRHSSSVQDKIRVVYPPALMMNALLLGKALVH